MPLAKKTVEATGLAKAYQAAWGLFAVGSRARSSPVAGLILPYSFKCQKLSQDSKIPKKL
jgi:hypothetical protein